METPAQTVPGWVPDAGTVLAGRFRVDGKRLGEGHTGVVVSGVDEQTGKLVAIKLLDESLCEDLDALQALEKEASEASRLSHRHVLDVHGMWAHDGHWFLVSEQVDGGPISSLGEPLSAKATVVLGLQLADALAAAHDADMVHGDVRPGNVLLGARGAKLFDFGAATWAGVAADGKAGRPGETAPEVLAGTAPSRSGDLYGLGVVLYRALTGELPYTGPTPYAVLGAQQNPPRRPQGPRGLTSLILQLLRPDPARRPPDARAVRTALEKLRKNPHKSVVVPRRWLAPFRPGGEWLVYGVDPATGTRALVRTDLSRRRARRLQRFLTDEGWEVRTAREALGWGDLLWVIAAALAASVILPIVGTFIGGWLALMWRSTLCRPALRERLPQATSPIPPRQGTPGAEYLVSMGLLLLVAAFLLWWWPLASVLPLIASVGVGVAWSRVNPRDPASDALRGRLATLSEEIRLALEYHPLDDGLALQGELEDLESTWRAGRVDHDDAVLRAESLRERAVAGMVRDDGGTARTLEALRRTRDPTTGS